MTSVPASAADTSRRTSGARILAWPRQLWLNPVLSIVHDGLERDFGWRIDPFSYWRAFVQRYKIVHYSFPSDVFRHRSPAITLVRVVLSLYALYFAKLLGRRVVWTVHNLREHEGHHPRLETTYMARYIDLVDRTVHLSEVGRDAAIARYPKLAGKPAVVIPHPRYAEPACGGVTREAALAVLGLPENCRLILTFGAVRRYKNLMKLVRAFHDLPDDDVRLIIAGYPRDTQLADAIGKIVADSRIKLTFRAIDDRETDLLFMAASLVVAPYTNILNSGTAIMALSHNRPILVPDRGAMSELQRQVGPLWVKLFEAPLSPLVLGDALHWAAAPRESRPDMTPYAPERIAAAYDHAFRTLT